jgi:hypothetical protein
MRFAGQILARAAPFCGESRFEFFMARISPGSVPPRLAHAVTHSTISTVGVVDTNPTEPGSRSEQPSDPTEEVIGSIPRILSWQQGSARQHYERDENSVLLNCISIH